jgi:hypothetical protein
MTPAEMYPGNPQAQALVKAAIKGDVKEIDRLIDAGANPNDVGAYGKTVPGWVLFHPNVAGFRRLLERGADPNIIWHDGTRAQSSLLHFTIYMSDKIGTDYLKMCLSVGKGNPNLEPPDGRERPIAVTVNNINTDAFYILYNAGADINYKIRSSYRARSLAEVCASQNNHRILFFLLSSGVHYSTEKRGVWDLHSSLQGEMGAHYARDKNDPLYIWFWRCVDLLEKRGMKFHYGIAIRPAVLDTTPPDVLGPEGGK